MKKLFAAFAVLGAMQLGLANSKLAPELRDMDDASTVDVIVQFVHAPAEHHYQRLVQRGAGLKARLGLVRAGAFRINGQLLRELEKDPHIALSLWTGQ